jgi:hypothetical protein
MSFWRRLFGGAPAEPPGPDRTKMEEYKGFRIIPAPRPHNGQFLTSAVIEKDFPDGMKTHLLIRADTHPSPDDAGSFAVAKARQVIDEQGERLFG